MGTETEASANPNPHTSGTGGTGCGSKSTKTDFVSQSAVTRAKKKGRYPVPNRFPCPEKDTTERVIIDKSGSSTNVVKLMRLVLNLEALAENMSACGKRDDLKKKGG